MLLGRSRRILAVSRGCRLYTKRLSWEERAEAMYQRDKALDSVVRRESAANIVRKVIAVVLARDAHIMSMDDLSRFPMKRRIKEIVREVATRFPLIFKFRKDVSGEFWIELTPEAEEIIRRDRAAAAAGHNDEHESLTKLKKLLMMAKHHRIGLEKLGHLKHDLFLPDDFKKRLIPQHPESFKIVAAVPPKDLPHVELVGWEPALAVTAREQSASPQSPHAFTIHAQAGLKIEKDLLHQFQELPFYSPYQEPGRIEWTGLEAEKRTAAVIHELLSVMPMKKVLFVRLNLIQKELQLPAKFLHLIGQYPWIFYVSKVIRENNTIFLRDGYPGSSLKLPNPQSVVRDDLLKLMGTFYERERSVPSQKTKLEVAPEDKEPIDDFFVRFFGNLRDL